MLYPIELPGQIQSDYYLLGAAGTSGLALETELFENAVGGDGILITLRLGICGTLGACGI